MTKVSCPSCAARYNVPEEKLGKRVKCAKCGNQFVLEAPEGDDFGFPELAALQSGEVVAQAPAAPAAATASATRAADHSPRAGAAMIGYLNDVFVGFLKILIQPWELITLAVVCIICMLQVAAQYAPCIGLGAQVIITGWYLSFLLKTVQSGAGRESGFPEFMLADGVMEDIVLPCLSFLTVRVITIVPLIAALAYAVSNNRLDGAVATVIAFLAVTMPELALITAFILGGQIPNLVTTVAPALLIGLAATPMLVLVVAIGGIGALVRVDLMLTTILRTLPGYLAATAIYFGSLGLAVGAGFLAQEALGDGASASALAADPNSAMDPNSAASGAAPSSAAAPATPSSPPSASPNPKRANSRFAGTVAGSALAMLVSVVSSVFAMRAIGLYYAHFKRNFAWSWG